MTRRPGPPTLAPPRQGATAFSLGSSASVSSTVTPGLPPPITASSAAGLLLSFIYYPQETTLYRTGFRASWTELCPPADPGGGSGGGPLVRADEVRVRLSNLTVVDNEAAQQGGGLFLSNQAGFTGRRAAIVTLANSTVSRNTAGGDGGALSAANATRLQVEAVAFENNTAVTGSGGAVAASFLPLLSLRACTFSGNSAGYFGGALAASFTPAAVALGSFAGNQATSAGGAVFSSHSPLLNVSATRFWDNRAFGVVAAGGAVLAVNVSAVNFDSADFQRNSVVETQLAGAPAVGAAAFSWPVGRGGAVLVHVASALSARDVLAAGGAAAAAALPSVRMANTTVAGSSAFSDGGGLAFSGPIVGRVRARARSRASPAGQAPLSMTHRVGKPAASAPRTLSRRTPDPSLSARAATQLENVTVADNVALSASGGGLSSWGAQLDLLSCSFLRNAVRGVPAKPCNRNYCEGGALRAAPGSAITCRRCTVQGNWAEQAGGAAIVEQGAALAVSDSLLEGNAAGDGGGTFAAEGGRLSLSDCVVRNSSAFLGALIAFDATTAGPAALEQALSLRGLTVEGMRATGGALFAVYDGNTSFAEPACDGCSFSDLAADFGPRVATEAASLSVAEPRRLTVHSGAPFDVSAHLFDAFGQRIVEYRKALSTLECAHRHPGNASAVVLPCSPTQTRGAAIALYGQGGVTFRRVAVAAAPGDSVLLVLAIAGLSAQLEFTVEPCRFLEQYDAARGECACVDSAVRDAAGACTCPGAHSLAAVTLPSGEASSACVATEPKDWTAVIAGVTVGGGVALIAGVVLAAALWARRAVARRLLLDAVNQKQIMNELNDALAIADNEEKMALAALWSLKSLLPSAAGISVAVFGDERGGMSVIACEVSAKTDAARRALRTAVMTGGRTATQTSLGGEVAPAPASRVAATPMSPSWVAPASGLFGAFKRPSNPRRTTDRTTERISERGADRGQLVDAHGNRGTDPGRSSDQPVRPTEPSRGTDPGRPSAADGGEAGVGVGVRESGDTSVSGGAAAAQKLRELSSTHSTQHHRSARRSVASSIASADSTPADGDGAGAGIRDVRRPSGLSESHGEGTFRGPMPSDRPPAYGRFSSAGQRIDASTLTSAEFAAINQEVVDSLDFPKGVQQFPDWAAPSGPLHSVRAITAPLVAGPVTVGSVTVHFDSLAVDERLLSAVPDFCSTVGGAVFVFRALCEGTGFMEQRSHPSTRPSQSHHRVSDRSSSDPLDAVDVRGGIVRAGGALFGRTRSVADNPHPPSRSLRLTQSMGGASSGTGPPDPARRVSIDAEARGADDQDAFALLDAENPEKVSQLHRWDLDAWDLDNAELCSLVVHMFHHQGLLKRFGLRPIVLEDFIDAVKDHYRRASGARRGARRLRSWQRGRVSSACEAQGTGRRAGGCEFGRTERSLPPRLSSAGTTRSTAGATPSQVRENARAPSPLPSRAVPPHLALAASEPPSPAPPSPPRAVTHTAWRLLALSATLRDVLSDQERFALLLSALCHDLEHTGTTNAYHINAGTDLALMYNDKHVLVRRPPPLAQQTPG